MAAGANTDWNNRQLHPDERKWIVNHAKDFARRLNGGREPTQAEIAQAERRLAQQAAKNTDLLWMITLPKTTNTEAQTFLRSARGSFTNQFGKSQRYFTTQGRDFIRPELYAIEANKDLRFYYRNLISSENKNIIRGTQDFAAKLGNQAVKAFRNDPIEAGLKTAAPVGNAIFFNGAKGGVHCLRNLSHCGRQVYRGTIDYFQGLGTSLREGATSLQLNNLRPIYGQNVRGIQGALLAIQTAEAILSAREAASILGSVKTGSIATANAVLHPVRTVNKARNAVSGFVIGRGLNNLPKTEVPLSELLNPPKPRVSHQPGHRPAVSPPPENVSKPVPSQPASPAALPKPANMANGRRVVEEIGIRPNSGTPQHMTQVKPTAGSGSSAATGRNTATRAKNSIFDSYPQATTLNLGHKTLLERAQFLSQHIPGLPVAQAKVILEMGARRNTSIVIGGSRVRGNATPKSDIDIGFGHLNPNQAGKAISQIQRDSAKIPDALKVEDTIIAPGNETKNIPRISSPEEFFQRSGTRVGRDGKAGQPFHPSGSVTIHPNGIIQINPPRK